MDYLCQNFYFEGGGGKGSKSLQVPVTRIYFHESLALGVQHKLLPYKLKSYLPSLAAVTENREQITSPREQSVPVQLS